MEEECVYLASRARIVRPFYGRARFLDQYNSIDTCVIFLVGRNNDRLGINKIEGIISM